MNNDMIQGIGYDKKPMPIYFYHGEKRYLFGLIKRKRFGTNISKSVPMPSGEITGMVKRFGDKAMLLTLSGSYLSLHRFYVIVREKKNGSREYFMALSASKKGGRQKARFTEDAMKAYISASYNDVKDSINMLRGLRPVDRVTCENIYLNTVNVIQQPVFVIYLYDVKDGRYSYLSKYTTDAEVRCCNTLYNALCMGYDDALDRYDKLSAKYSKNKYHFTVIRKLDIHVDAAGVPAYQQKHHDTGRVQVGFHLNAYHHGKK